MNLDDLVAVKKINLKNGDFELNAEGYTADEVCSILKLINKDNSHNKLNEPIKEKISEKHTRKINNNDIEEYDIKEVMKGAKLPRVTSDFKCTGCGQSIMFVNPIDSSIILRSLKDNTLHKTNIDLNSLPDDLYSNGEINYDKFILLYNDLIEYAESENLTLISDSDDEIICPCCNTKMTIKEAVKHFEKYYNEDACPVCGGEVERTISQDGNKITCKEHQCLSKIKLK